MPIEECILHAPPTWPRVRSGSARGGFAKSWVRAGICGPSTQGPRAASCATFSQANSHRQTAGAKIENQTQLIALTLVFRSLKVEFSATLGKVESTFSKHPRSPHPDIFRVSNDHTEGCTGVGRTGWHVDGTFMRTPFMYQVNALLSGWRLSLLAASVTSVSCVDNVFPECGQRWQHSFHSAKRAVWVSISMSFALFDSTDVNLCVRLHGQTTRNRKRRKRGGIGTSTGALAPVITNYDARTVSIPRVLLQMRRLMSAHTVTGRSQVVDDDRTSLQPSTASCIRGMRHYWVRGKPFGPESTYLCWCSWSLYQNDKPLLTSWFVCSAPFSSWKDPLFPRRRTFCGRMAARQRRLANAKSTTRVDAAGQARARRDHWRDRGANGQPRPRDGVGEGRHGDQRQLGFGPLRSTRHARRPEKGVWTKTT